jgi:carboxyl-terminal processing protease
MNMNKRSASVWIVALVGSLILSACGLPGLNLNRAQPTAAIPIDLPLKTQNQLRDFDLATRAIRATYIDTNAVGADWQKTVTSFRERVVKGVDDTQFIDTLNELLDTLNDEDLTLSAPTAQPTPAPDATQPVTAAFTGIGVLVALPEPGKNRILLLAVYPDSPAAQAGLKAHDAIIAIDGSPVTFEERATVTSRIRGLNGSKVTLTIQSPGQVARDMIVTRGAIAPGSTLVAKRVQGTNIGYIRPDFTDAEGMRLAVAQGLRELSTPQTLDGLVLDMRTMQNAGFPMADMLGLFANGAVGTFYTRTAKSKLNVTGKNIAGSQELPLVVLVSDQTRGVAESFAGILQDLGRARIAGTQSPGRLAQLLPVALPNSGALLLIPAGEYRGVKDTSWYRHGITPDIRSDLTWEQFTDEDDPQLKQATQALTR